jgi:hypothetical protein
VGRKEGRRGEKEGWKSASGKHGSDEKNGSGKSDGRKEEVLTLFDSCHHSSLTNRSPFLCHQRYVYISI